MPLCACVMPVCICVPGVCASMCVCVCASMCVYVQAHSHRGFVTKETLKIVKYELLYEFHWLQTPRLRAWLCVCVCVCTGSCVQTRFCCCWYMYVQGDCKVAQHGITPELNI